MSDDPRGIFMGEGEARGRMAGGREALPAPSGFAWSMPAVVVRWHDGDTAVCHVKAYPAEGGDLYEVNVRIQGINAPELGTPEGAAARDHAAGLAPPGLHVILVATRREKYGRFLARMVLPTGEDVSELMVRDGQAVPFMA